MLTTAEQPDGSCSTCVGSNLSSVPRLNMTRPPGQDAPPLLAAFRLTSHRLTSMQTSWCHRRCAICTSAAPQSDTRATGVLGHDLRKSAILGILQAGLRVRPPVLRSSDSLCSRAFQPGAQQAQGGYGAFCSENLYSADPSCQHHLLLRSRCVLSLSLQREALQAQILTFHCSNGGRFPHNTRVHVFGDPTTRQQHDLLALARRGPTVATAEQKLPTKKVRPGCPASWSAPSTPTFAFRYNTATGRSLFQ
jgi:hypothetical protein